MIEWIHLISSILLLIVTGTYVYLTKRILESSQSASRLSLNPVVGIEVGEIGVGEVYGKYYRRNMNIDLSLTNVGNAPAIEALVDAEVILAYSRIKGETCIPSRFEPQMIPFIQPGQTVEDRSLSFGNTLITHLFDDFREQERLNIHRIETDATKEPFTSSQLRIIMLYRNSIGQYFQSTYQVHLHIGPDLRSQIPDENESCPLIQINIPRPRFHASPMSQEVVNKELEKRNRLRDLCGW